MSKQYFSCTSIEKWSVEKVTEYLANKGIIIDKKLNGLELSRLTLKEMRNTFGFGSGETIYLITRERIEKEALAKSNKKTNKIQKIRYVNNGNDYIKAQTPYVSPDSSPDFITSNSNLTVSSLTLESNKVESNIQQSKHISLLNNVKNAKDVVERYELYNLFKFTVIHPPLLWQNEHLSFFLNFIGCDCNLLKNIDIDDFIFLTAKEIDMIYKNKGQFIYDSLRSKFIDPTIKKIHKKSKLLQ